MKEVEVKIPIKGTKLFIHGVLRGKYSQPLVILAHGLGGWMHETLMYNASRFLEKQGFASLRVSFIGWEEDQRDIRDFGINENAKDIDTVVEFAKRKGAEWIAVVGHSYGGMAIVYSQEQAFDVAVLWDPSHSDDYDTKESKLNLKEDYTFIEELVSYVSGKGSGGVLSKKVFEDYQPGSQAMANKFSVPTLILNASWSKEMQEYGKRYAESIQAKTEQKVISDSSHPFVEDGAMEKLFEATCEWLKKRL